MDLSEPARVRFAPSPTGHLHIGGARTALYNYLLAQKTGGKFILRIEDTDRKRFVEGAEQELIDGLNWLGIHWDEGPDISGPFGPYRQSQRKEIYLSYARKLVEMGQAYYCFCSPERLEKVRQEQQKNKINPHYDGTCRGLSLDEADGRISRGEPHVIRFKTPQEGKTRVTDMLRGEMVLENSQIDDYVLVKSDGFALYHLAATVDDHLMEITHVIRGSEWLGTFPVHVLIHQAFGWKPPIYGHLSVFLKPSGKGKMSKRETADLIKDGHSIFVKDLMGLGYLPEAAVNWIALMGWSYDDHTEFFQMQDLIDKFQLEKLNPAPAAINFTKFDYFNGLHIRSLDAQNLAWRVQPFFKAAGKEADLQTLIKIAPLIRERLATLDEAVDFGGFFFEEKVNPAAQDLVAKGLTAAESAAVAERVYEILISLENLDHTTVETPLRELVEHLGLSAGQVFGIMRVAVTGQKVSPPLFESMEIIGRDKVLERIQNAITQLKSVIE